MVPICLVIESSSNVTATKGHKKNASSVVVRVRKSFWWSRIFSAIRKTNFKTKIKKNRFKKEKKDKKSKKTQSNSNNKTNKNTKTSVTKRHTEKNDQGRRWWYIHT